MPDAYVLKHPILSQVFACLIAGFGFLIISAIVSGDGDDFLGMIVPSIFVGGVFAYPFVITIYEIIYLIVAILKKTDDEKGRTGRRLLIAYDMLSCFAAFLYAYVYLELADDVMFGADWSKQLVNNQKHSPFYSESALTIVVIVSLFIIALGVLLAIAPEYRPPLVTVLCISMLYMGTILVTVIYIHLMKLFMTDFIGLLFFALIEINVIAITARVVILEVKAYQPDPDRMSKINSALILKKCNEMLDDSGKWPLYAFILMWPLFGVVIMVLILFGQAPNSVIKAFTETADYTFSTRIPPQNLTVDEHYLCTVAARGHERVVKPLRMGKRHGHAVVVNRQLCIANAFEQILEEKTPRIHTKVRGFYDKYGFPVAMLIKSRYTADVIWFIMKPLEWMFLAVIYLTDVHPEDRIARQYL